MKSNNIIELATEFKAYEFLSRDYRTFDASELPDGTVVDAESFFPGVSMNMGGWVSYTGNTSPDEEFAQIMRSCFSPIQVVDACDLH